jgi:hypothetical protein
MMMMVIQDFQRFWISGGLHNMPRGIILSWGFHIPNVYSGKLLATTSGRVHALRKGAPEYIPERLYLGP